MIHKPKWLAKTIATSRGYELDGELLKAARLTPEQIAEWNGTASAPVVKEMITEADPEPVVEEDVDSALDNMTKKELEDLGREHGIELDRRQKKETLIEQLSGIINS